MGYRMPPDFPINKSIAERYTSRDVDFARKTFLEKTEVAAFYCCFLFSFLCSFISILLTGVTTLSISPRISGGWKIFFSRCAPNRDARTLELPSLREAGDGGGWGNKTRRITANVSHRTYLPQTFDLFAVPIEIRDPWRQTRR